MSKSVANGKLTVKPIKSAAAKVVPKAKKPAPVKASDASHPTYFQMIKEALLALKERSGSSPHAIAKYMEEKHSKILPANFKKILAIQLKNCVANGKLIKVKASFKLSDASKKDVKAVPKPVEKIKAIAEKKKPATKQAGKKPAAPTKKKPANVVAKKAGLKKPAAGVAKRVVPKKPAAGAAKKATGLKKPAAGVAKKVGPKKPAAGAAKKATGLKKPSGVVAKKAGVKKDKTKAATLIKPKSIRSPAAKRARRV